MSSAPGRGARPVRIGNCSGFYGDRASAMADMARAGGIDVLTGDYLAEVTMLILGKARAKDSSTGYAATFLDHLDRALDDLVANGIRLVVNAGGLNPAGLADATRQLVARRGHDLRVSFVDGDDVFGRLDALQHAGHALPHLTSGEPLSSWPHRPLTANAYLGGFGIARALEHGADIVVTGRVTDASLAVGPAAWWWSWTAVRLRRPGRRGRRRACHRMRAPGDRRQLLRVPEHPRPRAAGVPDRGDRRGRLRGDHQEPGHRRRGHAGHGHRPTALRDRRPRLSQPRRDHPPGHRHAHRPRRRPRADQRRAWHTATRDDQGRSHRCRRLAEQRAARAHRPRPRREGRARRARRPRYAESVDGIGEVAVDRIGTVRDDPDSQQAGSQLLRIAVQGTREAAGRAFSSRMVELALSGYPGLYSLGPPQPGSAFGVYWPALLEQRLLEHTVHHHDGTAEIVVPGDPPGGEDAAISPAEESSGCHRPLRRGAATWSSSRSGRSCTPARATRAATRISVSGYATGRMGLAPLEPHRRRTPPPPARDTRPADRALRTAQPRRGQLPHPGIARDRRHLDAATGRPGEGARRMAAIPQRQGARGSRSVLADQRGRAAHDELRPPPFTGAAVCVCSVSPLGHRCDVPRHRSQVSRDIVHVRARWLTVGNAGLASAPARGRRRRSP